MHSPITRYIGLLLFFSVFTHLNIVVIAQEPVDIIQPVTGEMTLLLMNDDLVWLDTLTGDYRSLVEDGLVTRYEFDSTGQLIAYQDYMGLDISYYDLTQDTIHEFEVDNSDSRYFPIGWTTNSIEIVLAKTTILAALHTRFELFRFNIDTQVLTPLNKVFDTFEMLPPDFPLLDGVQSAYVTDIHFNQNPAFDEWILLEVGAIDAAFASKEELPSLVDMPPEAVVNMLVLWNMSTNTYVPLSSQLFPGEGIVPLGHWHPSGTLLMTYVGSDMRIVDFNPETATASVVQTLMSRPLNPMIAWLGVDTLLVFTDRDELTNERVITIRQIIDDALLETEFMRISSDLQNKQSEFYLSANLEEQYALSCLFDQALPTQLSIGMHAQVQDTVGSQNIFDEPFAFFRTITGQVETGTTFTIVDGPACSSGARLWQVELDGGLIGWVTEADAEAYYLEGNP